MTPDPITAQAIAVTLQARVRELVVIHNWYVVNRWARGPEWDAMRHDDRVELRALIRLARRARRLARETVEREDAVTQGLAWHDWQSNAEAQAIR
jgi:hypothetical protein